MTGAGRTLVVAQARGTYSGPTRSATKAAMSADVVCPAQATPAAAAPLSIAFVRRCKAITVGDDVIAQEAFEAAIEAHRRAWDPFETARTRLLYGGRLRRAGQRVAARGHLSAPRDAFHSMDLTHWSRVAADELAATGAMARRRPLTADEPLTSQETRVALLVAQGMSNREIGASLFLSPKTVERHLSNVFRKHGFRSRAELAAILCPTSRLAVDQSAAAVRTSDRAAQPKTFKPCGVALGRLPQHGAARCGRKRLEPGRYDGVTRPDPAGDEAAAGAFAELARRDQAASGVGEITVSRPCAPDASLREAIQALCRSGSCPSALSADPGRCRATYGSPRCRRSRRAAATASRNASWLAQSIARGSCSPLVVIM